MEGELLLLPIFVIYHFFATAADQSETLDRREWMCFFLKHSLLHARPNITDASGEKYRLGSTRSGAYVGYLLCFGTSRRASSLCELYHTVTDHFKIILRIEFYRRENAKRSNTRLQKT